MEKYDNYKDSGIEWIGEIPQHWEVKKIKQFTNILTGSTPKSTEETYWNGDINWVTTDDLGKLKTKDIIESRRQITEKGFNSSGTYLAPVDSIVLSTRAPIGHIGILKIEACTNQGCKTIIANKKFDSVFLYYYLHSGKSFLNSLGVGTTFVELPTQSLKDFTVPFPTPEEQTAIANYLDRKTTEIDELITDKKRLLELYDEEKTAIINQAVTKGINPNVPMKDSGIEWLGEIPEHWEVLPIKYTLSTPITDGPHETPELLPDGIPFISAEAIKNDKIDFNKKRGFISREEHERFSLKYKPQIGDVYMIKSGATTGNLAIVETDIEFNIWSPLAAMRPNYDVLLSEFLFYFMKSKSFFAAIEIGWNYGTQQNIGMKVLENIRMVLPTINEQKQIVEHIKVQLTLLNSQIEKVNKLIDLLTEYRTALISEVVTGKIKVTE